MKMYCMRKVRSCEDWHRTGKAHPARFLLSSSSSSSSCDCDSPPTKTAFFVESPCGPIGVRELPGYHRIYSWVQKESPPPTPPKHFPFSSPKHSAVFPFQVLFQPKASPPLAPPRMIDIFFALFHAALRKGWWVLERSSSSTRHHLPFPGTRCVLVESFKWHQKQRRNQKKRKRKNRGTERVQVETGAYLHTRKNALALIV